MTETIIYSGTQLPRDLDAVKAAAGRVSIGDLETVLTFIRAASPVEVPAALTMVQSDELVETERVDAAMRAVRVIQRVLCGGDDSGDFIHMQSLREELVRTQGDLITALGLTERPGTGIWACESAPGVMTGHVEASTP